MSTYEKLLSEKEVLFFLVFFQTPGILCRGRGRVWEFYLAKSVDTQYTAHKDCMEPAVWKKLLNFITSSLLALTKLRLGDLKKGYF